MIRQNKKKLRDESKSPFDTFFDTSQVDKLHGSPSIHQQFAQNLKSHLVQWCFLLLILTKMTFNIFKLAYFNKISKAYANELEYVSKGLIINCILIDWFQDAYQRRPLLENHDSSSDDDAGGATNFGYTRKKTKTPRNTANVHIDIPTDENAANDDDSDSEDDDGIPSEPLKTLVAFIFLFFAWVATTTSLALTHERVPQIAPLPDIFLDNVQYQPWGLDASEILIMVSTWTAFVVSLFHKHRFIVILYFLFLKMCFLF